MASAYCIKTNNEHEYISYITKGPGLLFDPVGTLKVTNDHLHVVIPVDVAPFKRHIQYVQNVLNTIKEQCQKSKEINDSVCHDVLQPLESLHNDILRDFDSISHIITNDRVKRSAWFSGVGTVLRHIFGTLDEDDAANYNNAIKVLYDNDKKLADSIKKTVVVSQSAIANINQSLHDINKNQIKLNSAVDTLFDNVKSINEAVMLDSFRIKFINVINCLQSHMLTLSFKMEDILNSILFVQNNVLHPSVLSAKQLYEDIYQNHKVIPKDKDLPLRLDLSNIHAIMNTAQLLCYYSDNKLIFVVKIPLVNVLDYKLYATIPLPIPHKDVNNNSFVYIIPTEPYLALSSDKSYFTYLKELSQCKIIPPEIYMCEISNIYSVPGNPSCDIEIMTKTLSEIPNSCMYKYIYGEVDIWHKLNNNNWIFVESSRDKLIIECGNKIIFESVISGTGILDVPIDCIAYYKSLKFIKRSDPKINIPIITPDFDILSDDCCDLRRFNNLKSNLPVSRINNINLQELKTFKSVTSEINDDLNIVDPQSSLSNHISFPIMTVISIILILCIVSFYFCKKFKNRIVKGEQNVNARDLEMDDIEVSQSSDSPRLRIN